MPYQVTFHGIGHNEALVVHDELEKKRGGCVAHVASNRNEGNARDL